MSSRDAEIAKVAAQIKDRLDDLEDTVRALNRFLAGEAPAGTDVLAEGDAPNERQPG